MRQNAFARYFVVLFFGLFILPWAVFVLSADDSISTSTACDSSSYLEFAKCAEFLRERNQIDEATLTNELREGNAILLDARGKEAYDALHIDGSVNLPYTSFSASNLAHIIPDKDARIIIYCRNNFRLSGTDDPEQVPPQSFESFKAEFEDIEFRKGASVGLNVPTFITLYAYGYRNVYELSSVFDPANTSLPITGTSRHAMNR